MPRGAHAPRVGIFLLAPRAQSSCASRYNARHQRHGLWRASAGWPRRASRPRAGPASPHRRPRRRSQRLHRQQRRLGAAWTWRQVGAARLAWQGREVGFIRRGPPHRRAQGCAGCYSLRRHRSWAGQHTRHARRACRQAEVGALGPGSTARQSRRVYTRRGRAKAQHRGRSHRPRSCSKRRAVRRQSGRRHYARTEG